jgi:hypothetical protein
MVTAGLLAVLVLGIAGACLAQTTEDPRQREVTVRLRDVSLRAALDILLRDTGLTYQLPRDIDVDRITVDLERLPLEQALHAILTAQGLTYRYMPDAKLYIIERVPAPPPPAEKVAPEVPPTPAATTTPETTAAPPAERGHVVTRVIALRYADAADLAALFGGLSATSRFAPGPSGYGAGYGTGPYGGLSPGYGGYNPYGIGATVYRGIPPLFPYGQNNGYPSYGPYGGYGTGYGGYASPYGTNAYPTR